MDVFPQLNWLIPKGTKVLAIMSSLGRKEPINVSFSVFRVELSSRILGRMDIL